MITKHKSCVEPFVQYRGIETIIDIINLNKETSIISECLNILTNVVEANEEYKLILIRIKLDSILHKKIESNISLEDIAKSIYLINQDLIIKMNDIKIDSFSDNKIKPEIVNYLLKGKMVKV